MDNYYEYLRAFSQELGARIVEMYPPLQEPNDPLPLALRRFCGSRFLPRP